MSIDGHCGIDPITFVEGGSCNTSAYCCSAFGYCGVGDQYCVGCQQGYGYCPKQCDANTQFCGPAALPTLIISVVGLILSVVGCVMSMLPFLPVRGHNANANANAP